MITMMNAKRNHTERTYSSLSFHAPHGFTLVELIIVIVVISILAAIVLVSYGAIVTKAHDANVKATIKQLTDHLDARYVESGVYPDINGGGGNGAGTIFQDSRYRPSDKASNYYQWGGSTHAFSDPAEFPSSESTWVKTFKGQYAVIEFCRPNINVPVTGIRIYFYQGASDSVETLTTNNGQDCL